MHIFLLTGVFRSGAATLGGMLCHMNRIATVEFSFLQVPHTMLSATCNDVY